MPSDTVVLESLRKEYYEVVAVRDVSLSVPEGEIFGLIGPNGAGKTTLLRMLGTTLEPTAGRAMLAGVDVWDHPTRVRGQIGFMPDFFQMYNRLTVRELLTYFGIAHRLSGRELRQRVDEVIDSAELREKRDSLVKGLSRGMTQRLGLARAIIHRPKVLLLDEPASGLDPLARRSLFAILRRANSEGATILISSHILGELSELCTSVGIMHRGRFLEAGRTDEILRKVVPRRRLALRVTAGAAQAAQALAGMPGVSEVKADGNRVEFSLEGDDAALAAINAALVAGGAGVALLEEIRTTLNELYFLIAERESDARSE
jgi:ABC-2 type transport system ATP-binding protein